MQRFERGVSTTNCQPAMSDRPGIERTSLSGRRRAPQSDERKESTFWTPSSRYRVAIDPPLGIAAITCLLNGLCLSRLAPDLVDQTFRQDLRRADRCRTYRFRELLIRNDKLQRSGPGLCRILASADEFAFGILDNGLVFDLRCMAGRIAVVIFNRRAAGHDCTAAPNLGQS